jgi:hypothetical protein
MSSIFTSVTQGEGSGTLVQDSVRHLTQKALARRWCLSARTLERWRWLGQGPAFLKLGGRVAYRLEDSEAFEAAQTRDTANTSQQSRTDTRVGVIDK